MSDKKTIVPTIESSDAGNALNSIEDLPESHRRVVEKMRKMNAEDGFKFLVACGIYTPDGRLAKEYGG